MASTPPPPVDGEDDRASEPTKNLRLGDAERIAAERLLAGAEPMMPALDAAARLTADATAAAEALESLQRLLQ